MKYKGRIMWVPREPTDEEIELAQQQKREMLTFPERFEKTELGSLKYNGLVYVGKWPDGINIKV